MDQVDDNTDTDDRDGDHNHDAPIADPVLIALQLCQLAANPKTIAAAVKKLRRLDRQYADTEAKLAALTAQAVAIETALTQRAAELAARAAETERRTTEFENSLHEARDHLRAYYDRITEVDRHLRWRVLNHADLLHGYNAQLQQLPDWPVIRRMVAGLPPDPPPLEREVSHPRIDAMSDTFSDPNADRHGNVFLGTLSRDVSHKGAA